MVVGISAWVALTEQDVEVVYSRAVGKQLVEGEYGLVAGAHSRVVVIGEGGGGRILVVARRMYE